MSERLTRAGARAAGLLQGSPETGGQPTLVHLGFGAFARAHTAVYTEDANRLSGEPPWRIIGVTQRSNTVADQLNPQGGLYTVVEEGPDSTSAQLITCVERILSGPEEPDEVVQAIASPQTHLVTLTITEKGYRLNPHAATGAVNLEDPMIIADLAGAAPLTAVGQIVRGIQVRAAHSSGPLTVVSCDNLPGNGRLTAGAVQSFIGALPENEAEHLREWTKTHVRFPNTMVDRMVPQPTEKTVVAAESATGFYDAGTVSSEHFKQWVIDGDFAGPRPAWEASGAVFSDQVEEWENTKLRILNAGHTLLAYLGLWAGHASISQVVGDEAFVRACRLMFAEEVLPTLKLPAGLKGEVYCDEVLRRFANPRLGHTTEKVGSDGSQKIGPRLLETVVENLAAGTVPRFAALALAAWIHHLVADPEPAINDPLKDQLRSAVETAVTPRGAVHAVLREATVFPVAVATHQAFAEAVIHWYGLLLEQDHGALRREVCNAP